MSDMRFHLAANFDLYWDENALGPNAGRWVLFDSHLQKVVAYLSPGDLYAMRTVLAAEGF